LKIQSPAVAKPAFCKRRRWVRDLGQALAQTRGGAIGRG